MMTATAPCTPLSLSCASPIRRRGPDHDADAGHVDVGELRAVDDEVAPGARGLVEDRRELVVGVQVDLAAQVHRWRVTVIPVRLKRG